MMVFRGGFRPRKPGPERSIPDGVFRAIRKAQGRKVPMSLPQIKCLETRAKD